MAKQSISPECKYGHGKMVAVKGKDGSITKFAAVHVSPKSDQLNLGHAYTFNVYECPVCSYLEFHDWELG